ncbi:MAG: hypothetical protein GY757_14395 [bacterium]|nr:hypothetical protein [bacterium]
MRENELLWFGSGNERSGFCFQPDLELFATGPVDSSQRSDGEAGKNKRNNAKHNNDKSDNGNSKGKDSGNAKFSGVPVELERIFSEARGKFSLSDLAKVSGFSTGDIGASLWDLAWRGLVSNDDYRAVRNGITGKFKPAQAPEMGRRSRGRYNLNRWQSSRPFSGNWFRVEAGEGEAEDALDRQDLIKDRIRQLFMRYGVVFRELLWNELPSLRWARVFPVLRLMELSGEIVSGQFFKGVYGLQFCTPAALGVLMRGLPEESVYWMNAADPASVCGIGIEGLKPLMPHRLVTSHLVFYGKQLVLVSRKNGKELTFMVEPGHPKIGEFMGFFKTLVGRDFNPLKYISVETVNDSPVLESDYREPLKEFGFKKDYRSMMLMKAY